MFYSTLFYFIYSFLLYFGLFLSILVYFGSVRLNTAELFYIILSNFYFILFCFISVVYEFSLFCAFFSLALKHITVFSVLSFFFDNYKVVIVWVT